MKLHTFNQDQERDKEVKKRKIEYKKKSSWKMHNSYNFQFDFYCQFKTINGSVFSYIISKINQHVVPKTSIMSLNL